MHRGPDMESNYDILGIEEGSTQKDIRDAFRRLALQVHSDRGGESAKFIRIKQAYEDLKVGKKYPDTPLEKLRSSRVFSGDADQEVRRRNEIIGREVSAEMREAEEWAGGPAPRQHNGDPDVRLKDPGGDGDGGEGQRGPAHEGKLHGQAASRMTAPS